MSKEVGFKVDVDGDGYCVLWLKMSYFQGWVYGGRYKRLNQALEASL